MYEQAAPKPFSFPHCPLPFPLTHTFPFLHLPKADFSLQQGCLVPPQALQS
jgi:hypothetical protein